MRDNEYMPSSDYPQAVLKYVQSQDWSANISELREGVYMILGSRSSDSGSEKMLLMIVCEPESNVTIKHIKYLLNKAKEKGANSTGLTTKVQINDEAQQAIEEYNISTITPDSIAAAVSAKNSGSVSKSSSKGSETSQDEGYEVYGTRWKMTMWAVVSAIFSLVIIWLFFTGGFRDATLVETLALYFCLFLFPIGSGIFSYAAIKHDPILRITDRGINYKNPIGSSIFYSWDDIEKVGRVEQSIKSSIIKSSTQIHLQIQVTEIENESALSEGLAQLDRVAIGDDSDAYYIPMSTYGIDFEEVAEAVNHYSDVPITGEI